MWKVLSRLKAAILLSVPFLISMAKGHSLDPGPLPLPPVCFVNVLHVHSLWASFASNGMPCAAKCAALV